MTAAAAEGRYPRILPGAPTRCDRCGAEIVWANARLAGWLGRSADSLQGENFRLLVPADDPQEVKRQMASLVAGVPSARLNVGMELSSLAACVSAFCENHDLHSAKAASA